MQHRYRQLLILLLAGYTYTRVVHKRDLDLGAFEWKLHVGILSTILICIPVLLPFDAFGPCGFWSLNDVRTTGGSVFGIYLAVTTIIMGICNTFGYNGIRRAVEARRRATSYLGTKGLKEQAAISCLSTYIFVSIVLYWPMIFNYSIITIETSAFGILEPVTTYAQILLAGSSGWVHSSAYFYNLRLKRLREQARKEGIILTSSATSCN